MVQALRDLETVFQALSRSPFRRKFRLSAGERGYLRAKGIATILEHGKELIASRLAPAHPDNDGKQTPFRGHPVFVAQHATGTCCRSCLYKWHGITPGHILSKAEQNHVLAVLERWLRLPQNY